MKDYKLIPYGISNFLQVMKENKYYADKTMFLPHMEDAGNFLFLTRPRRFGKSLFLSMMRAYYDINEAENFDRNFSGLYIHDHATPEMGQYQVFFLDFSQVGGNSLTAEKKFESYGCILWDKFADRYAKFYDADFVETVRTYHTFADKLTYITGKAAEKGHQLYLIVDEYDNFTNNILNAEGEHIYHEMTHAAGFYRDIFKLFKPNFTRILMMGVLPVTMDDLTSGYNISTNISLRPDFNTMLGLSEDEVRQMIRYYQSVGALKADEDQLVADMKPWYDNYCFAEEAFGTQPKVFNTDMVCYYLNHYLQLGRPPKEIIDPNTKTDYKKLKNIVRIGAVDISQKDIIHTIAGQGKYLCELKSSFPAEKLTEPDNFVSMLYYYGMLTIVGLRGAQLWLGIPNNNVRKQYYEYLINEYDRIAPIDTYAMQMSFYDAAYDGHWQPMIETITDAYHKNSSVRSLIEGERNLQGFMMAFFSLNPYYITAPEVEMAHGYCDFYFLPWHSRYPEVAHSYIVELKYLKANATDAEAEAQWQEAVAQIRQYATDESVLRQLDGTTLHLIVVQMKGGERLRAEEVRS